ncbi:MAG: anthranilate synthase component I family protein, partial [Bacteroidales bacterium]
MKRVPVRIEQRKILADIITPVSIYMKVRDIYPNALLLESSDYHSKENSFSFICLDPIAGFRVEQGEATIELPGQPAQSVTIDKKHRVVDLLNRFLESFDMEQNGNEMMVDGIFGYCTYDAVEYFEEITFRSPVPPGEQ